MIDGGQEFARGSVARKPVHSLRGGLEAREGRKRPIARCGVVDDRKGVGLAEHDPRSVKRRFGREPRRMNEAGVEARKLRHEWVISAAGKVTARGPGLENPKLSTGQIEVRVTSMQVLSTSPTPP